jgi:GAF domain-containing protein
VGLDFEAAEGEKTSAVHIISEEAIHLPSGHDGDSNKVESCSSLVAEVARKTECISQVSCLINQTVSLTKTILNAAASSVLLVDEGRQELYFDYADGDVGGALKRVKMSIQCGIAGWVARYGKPLIVNDVAKDRRFFKGIDEVTGFITKSIVCVPLVVRNKVIGVLEVLNKLDNSGFTEQDLEVLGTVAATAAQGIDNLRIHEELLYGYCNAVKALATVIDDKDPYTCGHSQRVK